MATLVALAKLAAMSPGLLASGEEFSKREREQERRGGRPTLNRKRGENFLFFFSTSPPPSTLNLNLSKKTLFPQAESPSPWASLPSRATPPRGPLSVPTVPLCSLAGTSPSSNPWMRPL